MTKTGAQRLIVASSVVTFGSVAMRSMLPEDKGGKGELPSPRILIGTGILYTVLSFSADPAPGLAGMFAAMIMTMAVMDNENGSWKILDAYFNPKNTKQPLDEWKGK